MLTWRTVEKFYIFIKLKTTKMIRNKLILCFLTVAALASCKVEENPIIERKYITSFALTFINTQNSQDSVTVKSLDANGEGGGLPAIVFIRLKPKTSYHVKITDLLNESVFPVINYLPQVIEEKEDHLFEYKISGTPHLRISNYDLDNNNEQLGLNAMVTCFSEGQTGLEITLRSKFDGYKSVSSPKGIVDRKADFLVFITN